jgi:NAD(P)-dependent dehydrogenase (short-subunit alcohol dehydrogenase family)
MTGLLNMNGGLPTVARPVKRLYLIRMKNVLITGCSSGFGLDTARYFLEQGWQVTATMRTPREDLLPRSESLRILQLDV